MGLESSIVEMNRCHGLSNLSVVLVINGIGKLYHLTNRYPYLLEQLYTFYNYWIGKSCQKTNRYNYL